MNFIFLTILFYITSQYFSNMIITISGALGSGKSTVAKILVRKFNLKHYSTGDFMREIAAKRGVTLLELSKLAETDKLWDTENHETIEQLDARVKYMKDFILKRKETNIAIVSHTTFLAYFLYGEIVDYDNELKHCFPYKLRLKSNTTYANK